MATGPAPAVELVARLAYRFLIHVTRAANRVRLIDKGLS